MYDNKYRKIFEDYKILRICFCQFKSLVSDILEIDGANGDINIVYKKSIIDVCLFTKKDIERALVYFLNKQIDDGEIVSWANILIMADFYGIDHVEENNQRKVMLEIIHRIANTRINSDLTDAMANYYLNCLNQVVMPSL